MVGYLIVSFFIGGMFGMVGMSMLACGSKMKLRQDNCIMNRRLEFLEKEGEKKRYKPVKDPRPRVHSLVH